LSDLFSGKGPELAILEKWFLYFYCLEEKMKMVSRIAFTVGLIASVLAIPAFAADRNVDVVNNTSKSIKGLYASRVNQSSWEENIVKGDPIGPGETQPVDVDDGSGACKFDFKAVFSDGTEAVNENVDVCQASSITYK
jgi:hypothetical protein